MFFLIMDLTPQDASHRHAGQLRVFPMSGAPDPKRDNIPEPTPEMIDAGAEALASFDRKSETYEEGATRIFSAMRVGASVKAPASPAADDPHSYDPKGI